VTRDCEAGQGSITAYREMVGDDLVGLVSSKGGGVGGGFGVAAERGWGKSGHGAGFRLHQDYGAQVGGKRRRALKLSTGIWTFDNMKLSKIFGNAKLSKTEIADIIEGFLLGTGGAWDWDDFISIRLSDPETESIRKICAELPDRFPPSGPRQYCNEEGLVVLRKLITELRHKGSGFDNLTS
jgi:hypothetical protein